MFTSLNGTSSFASISSTAMRKWSEIRASLCFFFLQESEEKDRVGRSMQGLVGWRVSSGILRLFDDHSSRQICCLQLDKKILWEIKDHRFVEAMRSGYLKTDEEFREENAWQSFLPHDIDS